MLQLLNFGTERSHCSEEMVRSQQNENYLGSSELFSLSHFTGSTGGNRKMLVEGFLFIHECFTTLMREESCLHLYEIVEITHSCLHLYDRVEITHSSFRLGCTLLQAVIVS